MLALLNVASGSFPAGSPDSAVEALQARLSAAGHEVEVRAVEPRELPQHLAAALHQPLDAVLVGGGDGTVSTATQILTGSGIALGIVPLGTMNLFARELGVPLELEAAAEALAHARPVDVDVGRVNGRTFAMIAALGMYPWMIRRRERMRAAQGRGRWPAMLGASLRVLASYPRLRLALQHDGEVTRVKTSLLIVSANSLAEHRGMFVQRQILDGGTLAVYVGRPDNPGRMLRFAWQAVLGHWRSNPELDMIQTRELVVRGTRSHLHVAVDGELMKLTLPLRFRIIPGGLRVLQPASPTANDTASGRRSRR